MTRRIIGIDVARALAVIGMVIVNFKLVIGNAGGGWPAAFASLFDGKAAATFVVLAGLGLALMTNTALNQEKWRRARKRIFKRAAFLFLVGLSYYWIWPADILHFYGVYMLIALLLINQRPRLILGVAIALILIYPLLLLLWDYETGWDFQQLTYTDFWTLPGFFRNLFYNGFHPVIPWTAFMLWGVWLGKQDLHNDAFVRKALRVSLAVFFTLQIASSGLIGLLANDNAAVREQLVPILGPPPMPPMPIYMFNGIAIATAVISACILIAKRFENNAIVQALKKTGQLALTFYVAHVIIGMGAIEAPAPEKLGTYSTAFSVTYALAFSMICIVFSIIWLKYRPAGPLEWVMRKVTD